MSFNCLKTKNIYLKKVTLKKKKNLTAIKIKTVLIINIGVTEIICKDSLNCIFK